MWISKAYNNYVLGRASRNDRIENEYRIKAKCETMANLQEKLVFKKFIK